MKIRFDIEEIYPVFRMKIAGSTMIHPVTNLETNEKNEIDGLISSRLSLEDVKKQRLNRWKVFYIMKRLHEKIIETN